VPLTRDYMFDWERAHGPASESKTGRAADRAAWFVRYPAASQPHV